MLLKNSETRLQQLIESADSWVWEVDKDGVYTYTSLQVWTLLGYRPHEVIGKSPFEFMDGDEVQKMSGFLLRRYQDIRRYQMGW